MAQLHSEWGFWMMHYSFRRLRYPWNHKKVYRIYTEMGLNLRRKYRKRLPSRVKEPLLQPLYPNLTWSMDFMEDRLLGDRRFRSFNVIDDFNREALSITIDRSINSKRVIRSLNQLIEWRGKPKRLRVDNGPEFISIALHQWTEENGIELQFIQKGKPSQNGYIERFNRTYREGVLNKFLFECLDQVRLISQAWMWSYNNERPHSALGYSTPAKFLLKYGNRCSIPTFQQDDNSINDWKKLVLSAT